MKAFLKKFCTKRKHGFTLIELLAIVVILGILAAVSVPTYNKLIKRSRVADGLNVLELLATAQDKYYVQHGQYAYNISELNAPLKDISVSSQPPYATIRTKNFDYTKGGDTTTNCLFAESNDAKMPYTLVKNYKTKATVGCSGSNCDKLKDYVAPVANLSELCPTGQETCQLTDEKCKDLGYLGLDPDVKCACLKNDDPPAVHCSGSDNTPWVATGDCKYTGEIPLFDSKKDNSRLADTGNETGEEPGTEPPANQGVCGTLMSRKVCNKATGKLEIQTDCVIKKCGKNQVLDKDCNCVPHKECDPNMTLICKGGYDICDPCKTEPNVPSILEQMEATLLDEPLDKSDNPNDPPNIHKLCYHCGYKQNSPDPICDYSTGKWKCVSNEEDPCTEIEGIIPTRQGDCDGIGVKGSKCGSYKLSDVQCKQNCSGGLQRGNEKGKPTIGGCDMPYLFPVYEGGCVLKPSSDCFDGETKSCANQNSNERGLGNDIGQMEDLGKYVCIGCQWSTDCKKCGDKNKYVTKYRKCTDPNQAVYPNVPVQEERGGDQPRGHTESDFCGNISSKPGDCNYYTQEYEDIFEGTCQGSYYSPSPCETATQQHDERGTGKGQSQCYVQKKSCDRVPGGGGIYGWVAGVGCEPKASWVECETGQIEGDRECKDCKWVYKAHSSTTTARG